MNEQHPHDGDQDYGEQPADVINEEEYADELVLGRLADALDRGEVDEEQVGIIMPFLFGGSAASRPPASVAPRLRRSVSPALTRTLVRALGPRIARTVNAANFARGLSAGGLTPAQVARLPQPKPKTYLTPLGINSRGEVAGGTTQVITVLPQTKFELRRFVVSDASAPHFLISTIMVGNTPVFATAEPVTADVFRRDSTGGFLRPIEAQPGISINVTVVNIDKAPHPFRGAFEGEASTLPGMC